MSLPPLRYCSFSGSFVFRFFGFLAPFSSGAHFLASSFFFWGGLGLGHCSRRAGLLQGVRFSGRGGLFQRLLYVVRPVVSFFSSSSPRSLFSQRPPKAVLLRQVWSGTRGTRTGLTVHRGRLFLAWRDLWPLVRPGDLEVSLWGRPLPSDVSHRRLHFLVVFLFASGSPFRLSQRLQW